jgi:hypothetical protein
MRTKVKEHERIQKQVLVGMSKTPNTNSSITQMNQVLINYQM